MGRALHPSMAQTSPRTCRAELAPGRRRYPERRCDPDPQNFALPREYRTGKYIHEFAKEADADAFVRIMKDKRVHIRYKQSNPNKTVLEQSVVEQHAMLAPSTD
jgi:hypothetical protein